MKIATQFMCLLLTVFIVGCHREVTLYDIDGNAIEQGKWLIINYWASWCEPCHEEIPELNAFHRAHEDVIILGVSFDQVPQTELPDIIQKMKIEFPTLATNPAKKLGLGEIPGIPVSYVITPNGKVHKRLFGAQTKKGLEASLKLS